MRNKIDYGIDLGTTNSAIARMENGVPVIKKSDTLRDIFPSCVHFSKKQDIFVGDTALNIYKNDCARALKSFKKESVNTFLEFKRTMGSTHKYFSSNMNRSYTSEELSAEIIKWLKLVVKDEELNSVVITVPAKFKNPQNEATIEAGKIIGFRQVQLLQEPVAAATAYGLTSKNKNGIWLVFDFGGGTFDAAIVKSEEGILSVKDTEGDNWLGGKNLDEAIIDSIILPYLKENYAIESLLSNINNKEMLRAAVKNYAEETKNQMSFKDNYRILSNLGDLPFEDENGDEPEIDLEISQKDLESVFKPIFQKAIDITKELLKRNNLKGSDLDSLILVGGPTFSPILRRMLKVQITDKIDTSVDPMTVVAKGAALFASTISISEDVLEEKRDKTKLQLELKYESTSVETEEMINIKILKDKSTGVYPEKIYAEITRNDKAWSSGRKLISEKASLFNIILNENASNTFNIILSDENANIIECQPDNFTILQGIAGLEQMQVLPYDIGIARYFDAEDTDLFQPVKGLEKNKSIPAVGVINRLRTRRTIRPGMKEDIIRIPVYQGSYSAAGTKPELNNLINEVVITGETIPALLPEGSHVDITIKVDRSQVMKFSAFFPSIEHTEELEIEIKPDQPPEINDLEKQIENTRFLAEKLSDSDVLNKIEDIEEKFEDKKGSGPGRMEILDNLRKVLFNLHLKENKAKWPNIEKDLKAVFFGFEDLLNKIVKAGFEDKIDMPKMRIILEEYRKKIEQIIKDKDMKNAKFLTDEIDSLDFSVRSKVTDNAMDADYLKDLDSNFNQYHWKDKTKAREFINRGLQLIAEGETKQIRPLIVELINLMPEDEKPVDTLGESN